MDKRARRLLLRSLEGPLKRGDRLRLDDALRKSDALRRYRDEIEALRQSLAAGAAGSFRPGFAGRVLARIEAEAAGEERQAAHYRRFKTVFRGFALASALVLAVLITYNLAHDELVPSDHLVYACDQTLGEIMNVPFF